MCFLNAREVFQVEKVCKSWQKAVGELSVWERLFEAENIPAIVGRRPDYKVYIVLRGMFDRGVSVEKIEKFYGTPVFEKMPQVSQEKYDLMFQPDPEEPAKKMFETYEAVFTPLAIKRTFGKDLAATMDAQGRLKITPKATENSSMEHELEIPFSFPNLVELSKYPLAGQENGPVFNIFEITVLEQCHECATKVGIYFMRSNILEKSYEKIWSEQETQAKNINQEIVPLNIRALSLSKKILESKQCPDGQTPRWIYSRTADCVQIGDHSYHVILGGFAFGTGILVNCSSDNGANSTGAAPGFPAEVSLKIDKV
jgi:hypothetical protein